MNLEWITYSHWDKNLWNAVEPIYREAFPSGAKTEQILHSMLDRGIAQFHIGRVHDVIVAMAVTGLSGEGKDPMLVIDYLAVDKNQRGQGIGRQFLHRICEWAEKEYHVKGIIIEVEAGTTDTHAERIHFWERSGFILTPYVHQYIWVPEPYQAMLLPLDPSIIIQDEGQSLFQHINSFHKKAYRQR